jgi:transcriptional regulator of acetoin/glycerol metabolism
MNDPADRRLRIAAARAAFLASGESAPPGVPEVVAASWQRSARAGVGEQALAITHYDDLDVTSRLVRCAQPVISRLSEETSDLALSIALTDSRARVLSRTDTSRTIGLLLDKVSLSTGFGYAEDSIGTNGIGTVLESGTSVHIQGPEHFVEALQPFACAGAPIRDPLTGRVEGILDISCLIEQSSPLMHSLVRSAARSIQQGLLVDHSQCQQALFDTYLRVDARSNEAVVAVGDSTVMTNTRAQHLLSGEDQSVLQEHARFLMARHVAPTDEIALPSGARVRIRGTRIMVGNDIAGLVAVVSALGPTTETGLGTDAEPLADYVLPPPHGPFAGGSLPLPRDGSPAPIAEGRTPAWRTAVADIERAFTGLEPLLVIGETGTGKFTLLTELFHVVHHGGRSISFDASDISNTSYDDAEEALAAATTPTLYVIRNIDELTTDGVDRLARFMLAVVEAETPVTVAATLSDQGLESDLPFRDLLSYFQTSVTVPPVRQRSADIQTLVTRLLTELAPQRDVRLSPESMALVCRYSWPRNVRQMREALASTLLKKPVGTVEATDLPGYCHTTARRQLSPLEQADRDAVIAALKAAGGNRVHTAKALGLARSSLYRRLKEYGITTV